MNNKLPSIIKCIDSRLEILHSLGFIFLENLDISEDLLASIAEKYGNIIDVGVGPHSKVSGKVFRLSNEDDILKKRDFTKFGDAWHHDYSVFSKKGTYTFLYAVSIPPEAGGTFLMNMALKHSLDQYIRSMGVANPHEAIVIHSYSPSKERSSELVINHPFTNKEHIYLGSSSFSKVQFREKELSAKILFEDISKINNVYLHKWKVGDLLIWDNRIVAHKAEGFDSTKYKRIMLRCAVN